MIDFILWFIKYFLPPMVANASPLLVRGVHRIDFHRRFIDGKPLLGANKTWEGLIIGLYMGLSVSIVYSLLFDEPLHIVIGFGASFSALAGDLLGSFIKRRLSIESGDPLPVVDQLDFALASTLYYFVLGVEEFTSRIDYIVYSLLMILALHVLTNNIAYYLGVKDKRW